MPRLPRNLKFALAAALILPPLPAIANATEQALVRHVVSASQAQAIIASSIAEAQKRGIEVSIVVVDPAGDVIAGHRMDGSGAAYFEIARRKAATSAMFRAPSKNIEDNVIKGLAGSGAFMGAIVLDDIMPRQGGLPVKHDSATIGAIGVSGATPDVDELIAQAGLDSLQRD